jgi:hypothetical protein
VAFSTNPCRDVANLSSVAPLLFAPPSSFRRAVSRRKTGNCKPSRVVPRICAKVNFSQPEPQRFRARAIAAEIGERLAQFVRQERDVPSPLQSLLKRLQAAEHISSRR